MDWKGLVSKVDSVLGWLGVVLLHPTHCSWRWGICGLMPGQKVKSDDGVATGSLYMITHSISH